VEKIPVPDRVIRGTAGQAITLFDFTMRQLFLARLRHISDSSDKADGMARLEKCPALCSNPTDCSVNHANGAVSDIEFTVAIRTDRKLDGSVDTITIIRVQTRKKRFVRDDSVSGKAEQFAAPLVPFENLIDQIVIEGSYPGRFQGERKLFLRFAKSILRLPPCRYVTSDTDETDRLARYVSLKLTLSCNPADLTILPADPILDLRYRFAIATTRGVRHRGKIIRQDHRFEIGRGALIDMIQAVKPGKLGRRRDKVRNDINGERAHSSRRLSSVQSLDDEAVVFIH